MGHDGHILRKAVVGSPTSFSCLCESQPSACKARNTDSLPLPTGLVRLHEPILLGEFLRKATESERLRLMFLRCLYLWLSGRAEPITHDNNVNCGLNILRSLWTIGVPQWGIGSS